MPTANMWSGESVEELARIQIEYLKKSGECLKREEIPGSGKGANGGKTGVSPFAARWRRKLWKERNLLRFRRRAGICRASFDLSEFATVRLSSSKIAAFTELRWLRY